MESMLTQLQDNELILLMYLADELPAQDMAQVQRMLDTDPALRAQLESLRHSLATLDHRFAAADIGNGAACPGLNPQAVANRTISAMQQWRIQAARRTASSPTRRRHISLPWWAYTTAAAAMLLLAFSIFLAHSSPGGLPAAPGLGQAPDWTDNSVADLPAQKEVAAYLSAADLDNTFDDADQVLAEAGDNAGIAEAEADLYTLQRATNDMDFSIHW